jgi:hypothetical protein
MLENKTKAKEKTNFLVGIVSFYHLLIHADGNIHEKELSTGALMIEHEGIDQALFYEYLNDFEQWERDDVLEKGLDALLKCKLDEQLRVMAWLSRLSNCDGFMDPTEWSLLYDVYYKKLNLKLQDILETQKSLPSEFL